MVRKIIKKITDPKRGETIAETVIAVAILAIGITLSSTLMANSLRNINTSKNRVIAVNIAREGIEAVRNIRDTNWLKFSGNRRVCWNQMPTDLAFANCSEGCVDADTDGVTDDPILPGEYIVYKAQGLGSNGTTNDTTCDTVQRWRLASVGDIGVNPNKITNTLLYQMDIDADINTDGEGTSTDDKDIYNHKIAVDPNANGNDVLGRFNVAGETNFFRTITIEYLENEPDSTSNTIPPTDTINANSATNEWDSVTDTSLLNRMRVTSKVIWYRGDAEHSVELKTHLTDYLGRDDLDS